MSRRQNELVGKFKMAVGDKGIRGQVMEYTYIPTGTKGVGEIWCGLQLEGVSRRDYWRTGGHSF